LIKRILSIVPDKSDSFLYLGTGAVFFGVYLIYPPAAYITVGLIFLYVAWLQAKPPVMLSAKESE